MIAAVAHVCARFTLVLAIVMLIPALADFLVGSPDWQVFVFSSALVGVPSLLLMIATRREIPPFSLRFGFLLVNSVWLSASVVSALPLYLSDLGLSFTDAVFEAASGITTTGSTVLSGLDDMPPGILLWRSMMQWLGGLGIIAMTMLLLPFLRVGGMQIYKMESSVQSESPFARFAQLSWSLLWLYVGLSLMCAIAYMLVGMDAFAAINHAMSTISTGGYSIHDSSMGGYGNGVLLVSIIFMIGGALPFIAMLTLIVGGDPRRAFDIQIPVLLVTLSVLSLAAGLSALSHNGGDPIDTLVDAAFNIVSVVTTTGYASADYTLWGPFSVSLFFVAMFLGGAAGSTSGGIKTYRLIIVGQSIGNGLRELIYPNGVFVLRYGGAPLPAAAAKSVSMFLSAFVVLLLGLTLVLGATGLDLLTAFSSALTALTNVGPGLGDIVGPAGNFSSLAPVAKWAMVIGMIAGRLEILTVLVLASPAFWRR